MLADVRPGDTLAQKYLVEGVLGRGGMGLVIAARHVQLDERVAIKLMLPEVAASADAVARFVREARAAAKIRSEHVVRVSDVGTLEGGQPYMVMEHLDGSDLAALLVARGRLPLEEIAEYVLQASEAIAEAHALGIVHRDLKPSNLYLTRRVDGSPVVKVLDFGISKVAASTNTLTAGTPSRTQTSALMGSPLYMSPEQMTSSRDVDARSDIWALGVIIYELLSGSPPFNGQTLPEVCALILESKMPPLRGKVPELPEEVEALVARCIVRDLTFRFRDVGELGRALVPFAPRRARVSIDRISAALGTAGTYTRAPSSDEPLAAPPANRGTEASWAESRPPEGSRVSRVTAAGVGFLALAGILGFVLLGRGTHPDSTAVPTPPHQDVAAAPRPAAVPASQPPTPVEQPSAAASIVPAPDVTPVPAASSQARAPSASSAVAEPHSPRPTASKIVTKPVVPESHPVLVSKPIAPAATAPAKPKAPVGLGGRL